MPATVNSTAQPAAPTVAKQPQPKAAEATKKASGGQEYSWNKKKLDPKDYMFSKLTGQVRSVFH